MIILPENGFGNNSLLRGLVGAWCPSAGPTGNVLRDLSGYRNNGVLTNMDASSDWVIDGGKYALDFDGVNDYVTFGNMPVINQAINITVSVWLYTRSTANFELGKYRSNQRGFLIFGAAATGFSFDGRDPNYISSGPSGAINLNQWYHVVGRKNGTVWSISVDGVQKSSTTSGTGTVALDNSNPFEIGRLLVDANAVGYQNGLISDVGLWNRALTAKEVRDLYRIGRGNLQTLLTQKPQRRIFGPFISPKTQTRKPNARGSLISRPPIESNYKNGMPLRDNEPLYPNLFKGIVGYWSPSAGPTGNRLRDLSGYNNHGTLTNMNAGTDWVVSGGKYALDFDAVDDYIQLASYGSLPNTGAISLQLNARPVTTSFPNAFGTESFTNNNHGFRLELSSANTLALVVGSTTSFTGHSAGTITSNKWEHILITWNVSENRIQILQNGIIRSDTTNTTWPSNLNNIRLGVGFTLGRYWNGLLDDFILYNRALSRNEQISIFRLGRGGILRSRQRAPYLATQELSTTFVKKDGEWCETEKSYIKKNNVWVPSNPVIYTNGNWR